MEQSVIMAQEATINALKADIAADEERLAWVALFLANHINGVDVLRRASTYATRFDHDQPTVQDYAKAMRDGIDHAHEPLALKHDGE